MHVEGCRGYINIVEDNLVYEQIVAKDRGNRILGFSQSSYRDATRRGALLDILAKTVLAILSMHQIMDCSRIDTRGDHLSCAGDAEGG